MTLGDIPGFLLVFFLPFDTEQFRKLQESERYVIHVSGTKNKKLLYSEHPSDNK